MLSEKKIPIIFIDFGSEGHSGFYINKKTEYLCEIYDIHLFVNFKYYYINNKINTYKIIGKLYTKSGGSKIVNFFKFLDYVVSLFKISLIIYSKFPRNTLLHMDVYQTFFFYKYFIYIMRIKYKIILTFHDIIPNSSKLSSFLLTEVQKLSEISSFTIVHNDYSYEYLNKKGYNSTILPFPVVTKENQKRDIGEPKNRIFLFLGSIRKEKGIENLFNAWRIYKKEINSHSLLIIAGTLTYDLNIELTDLDRCIYLFEKLDDSMYENLISICDFMVFPYIGGTNSGVYSNSLANLKPSICSCLPVFYESIYFNGMISYKNIDQFVESIRLCDFMPLNEYQKIQNEINRALLSGDVMVKKKYLEYFKSITFGR